MFPLQTHNPPILHQIFQIHVIDIKGFIESNVFFMERNGYPMVKSSSIVILLHLFICRLITIMDA